MDIATATAEGSKIGSALALLNNPTVATQDAYSLASNFAAQNCHGLPDHEMKAIRQAFFESAVAALGVELHYASEEVSKVAQANSLQHTHESIYGPDYVAPVVNTSPGIPNPGPVVARPAPAPTPLLATNLREG